MVHAVRHRGVTLYQQIEYITPFAERQEVIMARNRTYVGGKQSIGNPTLSRNSYFQMIKMIRREREKVAEAKATGGEVREDTTND